MTDYFGSVYGQIELKGKPPILSDEEIDEIDNSLGSEDWRFGEAIAEAQWSKAIEWFKKQGHEAISYLEGYQQARFYTLKEICEGIEKMKNPYQPKMVVTHSWENDRHHTFEECRQKILDLLKEEK